MSLLWGFARDIGRAWGCTNGTMSRPKHTSREQGGIEPPAGPAPLRRVCFSIVFPLCRFGLPPRWWATRSQMGLKTAGPSDATVFVSEPLSARAKAPSALSAGTTQPNFIEFLGFARGHQPCARSQKQVVSALRRTVVNLYEGCGVSLPACPAMRSQRRVAGALWDGCEQVLGC